MKTILSCLFCTLISVSAFASTKSYTIEQFLNTKALAGGVFTHDEQEILFSSDESGVFNVYSMPIQGSMAKSLTHSTTLAEYVVATFPHDDRFLFTHDGSGNELDHLYLQELDGSIRDLTPYPNAKSNFIGWNEDRTCFFFLSNVRNPKFMDLYSMDIETFTPTLLYQNENGYGEITLSKDQRYVALMKIRNSNDTNLYLLDLSTHQPKHLTPHQGNIKYVAMAFHVETQSLYYLTNENSEFLYLKRYDIHAGTHEVIEQEDWDILECSFSPSGRYRMTSTNVDGKTLIRLFDMHLQKAVNLPKMEEGFITDVVFSESDQYLLFYVEGDRSSPNLYLYEMSEGACRKLIDSQSPTMDTNDLVDAQIIRYPSYDGLKIPALYYAPKGISEGQKVPAMIWVHGGPGGQSRVGYHYLIQYLVNHGYAVLAVNNRGSSGYGKTFFQAADLKHGEADLDDCIWAKQFLISTGQIDENKIGIMGGSYGGYMTLAALAFRPNEMAVGVDIFGVSNWVRTLSSIPPWWEATRDALYNKIGHPVTQSDYLRAISPLFHADRIQKPLLILQGANDPRVLQVESDQMIEAVRKNGIPHRYVIFDDEGHGFKKKKNQIKAGEAILEFLDEHLR